DPPEMVDRMFAQTETMGAYRTSMVIDYVLGRPLEVETILGEPSRRAVALGLPAPTMQTLYAVVKAADLRHRGAIPELTPDNVLEFRCTRWSRSKPQRTSRRVQAFARRGLPVDTR